MARNMLSTIVRYQPVWSSTHMQCACNVQCDYAGCSYVGTWLGHYLLWCLQPNEYGVEEDDKQDGNIEDLVLRKLKQEQAELISPRHNQISFFLTVIFHMRMGKAESIKGCSCSGVHWKFHTWKRNPVTHDCIHQTTLQNLSFRM